MEILKGDVRMDFIQFTDEMKALLERELPELQFTIRQIEKLQGQSYTAISVSRQGGAASAGIDVEPFYRSVQQGESLFVVMEELLHTAREVAETLPECQTEFALDYEKLRKKLAMQVVSTAANRELLQKLPHRNLADLSVVYRFYLGDTENGTRTILITNLLLEQMGIRAEQLMQDAEKEAPVYLPLRIRNMGEVLQDLTGLEFREDFPMWVASTSGAVYGAGVLAYPDFLEYAANLLGGDYYLLPSSVHEVLLLADDGTMTAETLTGMVTSVNASEVQPEDRLTDNAYHYERQTRRFETASEYEARIHAVTVR